MSQQYLQETCSFCLSNDALPINYHSVVYESMALELQQDMREKSKEIMIQKIIEKTFALVLPADVVYIAEKRPQQLCYRERVSGRPVAWTVLGSVLLILELLKGIL